jgi:hypothetical protein
VARTETTSTQSRIYSLGSILVKRERLFLLRIATATITLQTLTLLRLVEAVEVAAGEEARIGVEGEPIGAPEPAITAAK